MRLRADVDRMVQAAVESYGGLDIMVANAGGGYFINRTGEIILTGFTIADQSKRLLTGVFAERGTLRSGFLPLLHRPVKPTIGHAMAMAKSLNA